MSRNYRTISIRHNGKTQAVHLDLQFMELLEEHLADPEGFVKERLRFIATNRIGCSRPRFIRDQFIRLLSRKLTSTVTVVDDLCGVNKRKKAGIQEDLGAHVETIRFPLKDSSE